MKNHTQHTSRQDFTLGAMVAGELVHSPKTQLPWNDGYSTLAINHLVETMDCGAGGLSPRNPIGEIIPFACPTAFEYKDWQKIWNQKWQGRHQTVN